MLGTSSKLFAFANLLAVCIISRGERCSDDNNGEGWEFAGPRTYVMRDDENEIASAGAAQDIKQVTECGFWLA